jgi:hypothetical protein
MGVKTFEIVTFDEKSHYAWLVWCPACDSPHSFDARWTFVNNDHERPTFTASMLVYANSISPRCHSFLTDGSWRYLADSTHSMAGQIVEAPDWASTRFGRMRPDGVVPE